MKLDQLSSDIAGMLEEAEIADSVVVERRELAGVGRLRLSRRLDHETRYLRITPTSTDAGPWDFEILGGAFDCADPAANFDGRRGGSRVYALSVVRAWLIQLVAWGQIANDDATQT